MLGFRGADQRRIRGACHHAPCYSFELETLLTSNSLSDCLTFSCKQKRIFNKRNGAVAGLVGIECGVVSRVIQPRIVRR